MGNKKVKKFYTLFFIGVTFFSAYILIEFRKDYIAVALAGILMLIAAYLLMNKIENDIYKKYELDKQDLDERFEQTSEQLLRGYKKIEQLERAIVHSSSGLEDQGTQQQIQQQMQPRKPILTENETQIELLLEQKKTMELMKQGLKTVIQFSKENARQVALNSNNNTDKLMKELEVLIIKLEDALPGIIESNLKGVQAQFDSMSEAYLENTSLVSQRMEEVAFLVEKMVTVEKE